MGAPRAARRLLNDIGWKDPFAKREFSLRQCELRQLQRLALANPRRARHAALYLAAYENRVSSRVDAGENRGRLLEHDCVVLEWQGPFAFGARTALAERRDLPLLPRARAAHSGVVGFVQDRRGAEVLQALMLPACPAGSLNP